MFPAVRVGDMTATGDAIMGPGMPTVLISNMPASVMSKMRSQVRRMPAAWPQ